MHIKMVKITLLDCGINEKCCSVDGGWGICPLFSSPPRVILTTQDSPPQGICQPRQKMLMPREGKLTDWCITTTNQVHACYMRIYMTNTFTKNWNIEGHILHSWRSLSSAISYSERVQSIHFIFSNATWFWRAMLGLFTLLLVFLPG